MKKLAERLTSHLQSLGVLESKLRFHCFSPTRNQRIRGAPRLISPQMSLLEAVKGKKGVENGQAKRTFWNSGFEL